jgi:hypothetical protein
MSIVEPQGGGGETAVGAGDDVLAADEFQRTNDWIKSWDFLETASCATISST